MSIKLEELDAREPITTHIPLPSGEMLKERYRHIQNLLSLKKKRSLHSLARERLMHLLDEVEAAINEAG